MTISIRLSHEDRDVKIEEMKLGMCTDMNLHLQEEVTLFQARALAKRIKQLCKEGLTVKVLTDEETIEIK